MTKYISLSLLIFTFQLKAQVGINTSLPESNLHIIHSNENLEKSGLGVPVVYNFTNEVLDDTNEGLLVYFDNQNINSKGKEGFYFWDDDKKSWQYIYKLGTEKENLSKISVRSDGFVLQGSETSGIWLKSTIDYIDTNNPNFTIREGNLIIGQTGKYSIFYSGAAKKNQGDNNLANVESGLFLNDDTNPIIFATSSIPSSDNNYRVSNLSYSTIVTLQKGDLLTFKFRKTNNYSLPVYFNHSKHYLTLTFLD